MSIFKSFHLLLKLKPMLAAIKATHNNHLIVPDDDDDDVVICQIRFCKNIFLSIVKSAYCWRIFAVSKVKNKTKNAIS